jgi:hypothetical protein
MGKKIKEAEKPPLWGRMFPLDKVSVLQAQFFDNRKKADSTRGQSDYALKVYAWNRMNKITLMADADWWRVLQLLEPKVVTKWAKAKHAVGGMTDSDLALYIDVAGAADEMMATGEFELVRIGHVGSPPGKQYCIGQFAVVTKRPEQPVEAILYVDGATMHLDQFKPTRARGAFRKPGSAVYAMIHDPSQLIGQSRKEAEGSTLRDRVVDRFAELRSGGE